MVFEHFYLNGAFAAMGSNAKRSLMSPSKEDTAKGQTLR